MKHPAEVTKHFSISSFAYVFFLRYNESRSQVFRHLPCRLPLISLKHHRTVTRICSSYKCPTDIHYQIWMSIFFFYCFYLHKVASESIRAYIKACSRRRRSNTRAREKHNDQHFSCRIINGNSWQWATKRLPNKFRVVRNLSRALFDRLNTSNALKEGPSWQITRTSTKLPSYVWQTLQQVSSILNNDFLMKIFAN